jgi:phosphoribosylaminoimidazole-succinocarboxamide synthase
MANRRAAETGSDSGASLFGPALFASDLRLPDARRGKVRDTYRLPGTGGGADRLLIVASDRISAFDVVMPTPIPGKGRLLTDMAAFWLRFVERRGICRTHLLSTEAGEVPAEALTPGTPREVLAGRVTIGRLCRVIPIECVVRGYLEGSGWKDYQRTGAVCGVRLPAGLRQCAKLPEPIFTPATKAEHGHDENIGFDEAARAVGGPLMERLRALSLSIYRAASAHAEARGIILADTKFEFGFELLPGGGVGEEPILIDEALTPDSSRFWPAESYEPGRAQRSFDKQFLREYLETLVASGVWDKTPPGPELPADVIAGTLERYRAARDLLLAP